MGKKVNASYTYNHLARNLEINFPTMSTKRCGGRRMQIFSRRAWRLLRDYTEKSIRLEIILAFGYVSLTIQRLWGTHYTRRAARCAYWVIGRRGGVDVIIRFIEPMTTSFNWSKPAFAFSVFLKYCFVSKRATRFRGSVFDGRLSDMGFFS